MSQTESRTAAAANRLIALLMKTILRGSPGVSRVRLAVVHNGIDDLSPTGNLRYDVTNSVPARGRPIGRMARNQKLSDWDAFLPALLAGQCALHRTTGSAPFGLTLPGTTNLLICPVHDLGVNAWSDMKCTPNPVFLWREWVIWPPVAKFLSTIVRFPPLFFFVPKSFHLQCA